MSRQVYIKGSLTDPDQCYVYDAANGAQLANITSMGVRVSVYSKTASTVSLVFSNGTSETCDLVPAPVPASTLSLAGKEAIILSLEQRRDHTHQAERIMCKANRYTIMPNGSLRPEKQTVAVKLMTDYALAQAKDPATVLALHAREACRDVTEELIKGLLASALVLPKPATSGHVGTTAPKFTKADIGSRVNVDRGGTTQYLGILSFSRPDGTLEVHLQDGTFWVGDPKHVTLAPSTGSKFTSTDVGNRVVVNVATPAGARLSGKQGTIASVREAHKQLTVLVDAVGSVDFDFDEVEFVPKTGMNATPTTCDECNGTGEWFNPFNGAKSDCSKGCKKP